MRDGWKMVKLGDVVSFKTGKLNANAMVNNGKYPFFTCSQQIYRTDTYSFDTECVLLGGNNANAVYPIFYFNGKFDAYQRTYVIETLHDDKIRFLYYLLSKKLSTLKEKSTGATTRFLTLKILNSLEIFLPDTKTQTQIASIISSYDDLIEKNEKRIKILEEMAQRLYTEWFVKFKFPGHEKVKMVDSGTEYGMVPEGWSISKMWQLCKKVTDGTHATPKPTKEGNYLITGKHIIDGFINFQGAYKISQTDHYEVMKRSKPEFGDTIFSNIGTLGSTVIVDQDFEYSIKNVALFKPKNWTYSSYIYLFLSNPSTLEYLFDKSSGTSQKFFSLEFLRKIRVISPEESILNTFSNAIDSIIKERSILHKRNVKLKEFRGSLIEELITGKRLLKNG